MRHFHDIESEVGICDDCGHECTAVVRDFGIGSYEFWGDRGTHHDFHAVSPCCEAPVVPGGETLVRRSTHVARKNHKDGRVKVGDKYTITVRRSWRQAGPSWVHVEKTIIVP